MSEQVIAKSLLRVNVLTATQIMHWETEYFFAERPGIPHYFDPDNKTCYTYGQWLPSESIEDAWQIREKVKTWLFSQRQAFTKNLLEVVSDRVIPNRHQHDRKLNLTEGDLLLHVEPVDFCLAALKTVDVNVVLELTRKLTPV